LRRLRYRPLAAPFDPDRYTISDADAAALLEAKPKARRTGEKATRTSLSQLSL
jgi:hypothetical protein